MKLSENYKVAVAKTRTEKKYFTTEIKIGSKSNDGNTKRAVEYNKDRGKRFYEVSL